MQPILGLAIDLLGRHGFISLLPLSYLPSTLARVKVGRCGRALADLPLQRDELRGQCTRGNGAESSRRQLASPAVRLAYRESSNDSFSVLLTNGHIVRLLIKILKCN